eukprot:3267582-Prymnesium_polylepis.1
MRLHQESPPRREDVTPQAYALAYATARAGGHVGGPTSLSGVPASSRVTPRGAETACPGVCMFSDFCPCSEEERGARPSVLADGAASWPAGQRGGYGLRAATRSPSRGPRRALARAQTTMHQQN